MDDEQKELKQLKSKENAEKRFLRAQQERERKEREYRRLSRDRNTLIVFYDFFRDEVQKFRGTNKKDAALSAVVNEIAIKPFEELDPGIQKIWKNAFQWGVYQEIEHKHGVGTAEGASKVTSLAYIKFKLNLISRELVDDEGAHDYTKSVPSLSVWKNTFKRFFSYLNYHGKETDPEKAPVITDIKPY